MRVCKRNKGNKFKAVYMNDKITKVASRHSLGENMIEGKFNVATVSMIDPTSKNMANPNVT